MLPDADRAAGRRRSCCRSLKGLLPERPRCWSRSRWRSAPAPRLLYARTVAAALAVHRARRRPGRLPRAVPAASRRSTSWSSPPDEAPVGRAGAAAPPDHAGRRDGLRRAADDVADDGRQAGRRQALPELRRAWRASPTWYRNAIERRRRHLRRRARDLHRPRSPQAELPTVRDLPAQPLHAARRAPTSSHAFEPLTRALPGRPVRRARRGPARATRLTSLASDLRIVVRAAAAARRPRRPTCRRSTATGRTSPPRRATTASPRTPRTAGARRRAPGRPASPATTSSAERAARRPRASCAR